uniref:Uncharacterized protein n=1 Tax=Anguilla anguilla TaxID=7936 RepID=A0A0E9R5U8_ANGAN
MAYMSLVYCPIDLLKSIFIALPNIPGTIKCENHRTISLMSYIIKILLRIALSRIKNKSRPETSKL